METKHKKYINLQRLLKNKLVPSQQSLMGEDFVRCEPQFIKTIYGTIK